MGTFSIILKFALVSSLLLAHASGFKSSYQTLLDLEWKAFKTQHGKLLAVIIMKIVHAKLSIFFYFSGKEYAYPKQDFLRKTLFLESKERVAMHNLEAAKGQHSYTMGLNQFSDKVWFYVIGCSKI